MVIYNTISSVDGVINARGVKSYPNNLEIYGYTHGIGTGEKSPDNPYILKSLDSGNVNLYSEDKITDIQVANAGAVRKGFEIDASKFKSNYCTIYFDEENTSPNLSDETSVGINIKFLYKNGTYETFTSKNFIKHIRIDKITEDVEKVIIYNSGPNLNAEYFSLYADLMIIDSPIMPSEYITDEHSILIQNNDMSIQVPVPIPLNSVEGVSDYIYKDSNGVWKLVQKCQKYNFTGTEEDLKINKNGVKFPVFYITEKQGLKTKNNTALICNYYNENPPGVIKSERKNFSIWNYSDEYPTLKRIYMIDTRFTTIDSFKSFLSKQYANGTPLTIVYQLETPIEHVLSDYTQDLLNSFTLQNQNEISVEGNPDIKISGYIQK